MGEEHRDAHDGGGDHEDQVEREHVLGHRDGPGRGQHRRPEDERDVEDAGAQQVA
jgi:hypothetical protein